MAPISPGVWIPFVAILAPAVAWAASMTVMMLGMKQRQSHCLKCHDEMLKMHKNADQYGFGTVSLRAKQEHSETIMARLIEDNTRAMKALTHYIVWFIKETTDKDPPPPIPVTQES